MFDLTRRQSIFAIVGGGIAVGTVGAVSIAGDEGELVRSIIHRTVGPFKMDEANFTAFVADLDTHHSWSSGAKNSLLRATSAVGPNNVLPQFPWLRDRFLTYEREVVTKFLTKTNYLQVDPAAEDIEFDGSLPCSSPFARFDLG